MLKTDYMFCFDCQKIFTEEQATPNCPHCDSEEVEFHRHPQEVCDACKGEGRTFVAPNDVIEHGYEPCHVCDGKGIIEEEE